MTAHLASVAIAVVAILGMWMLVRMSASSRREQLADKGCGYCGTALDPEVICNLCFVRIHQAGRDLPTGDHWR